MELEEQEQIMQITTSWEQKGIAKGQSNTILRQLNRKFGTLDNKIAEQIKALEASQLNSLSEDLLDFESIDDLDRWLSNS